VSSVIPICVAYGDGIGPEIMQQIIHILKEVEAPLRIETIEIGESIYKRNYSSGIADNSWEVLSRTKCLLKAPITTPQGGGYKSLNVTLRKRLGLFANIRPSKAYFPFVKTNYPNMDLVIIRENEEDLYTGIEYRQTFNTYQSLKIITESGSRRIAEFAFDFAKKNARKKVSCFSKDNIMKFTDGIFHKAFDIIAQKNLDIESNHYIVDIGTARLANSPELFDIIVTSNLYGDIISDVASEISGSVGMSGSANIGLNYAMFEAVHGSAPDIAGKNIANPSGLLNAAIMMLVHLGCYNEANLVENAWKKTLEDGFHTADIYNKDISHEKVGTKEFGQRIIQNLGKKPSQLKEACYKETISEKLNYINDVKIDNEEKKLIGVDIYIDFPTDSPASIAKLVEEINSNNYQLQFISTKGLKVWPLDEVQLFESEHWCLRIVRIEEYQFSHQDIAQILELLSKKNIDFIKIENLYNFGNERGYSLAQGE
jgi:isocitrate dehydrogenase